MIPYLSGGNNSSDRISKASARNRGDSFAQLIDVSRQEAEEYQTKIEVVENLIVIFMKYL